MGLKTLLHFYPTYVYGCVMCGLNLCVSVASVSSLLQSSSCNIIRAFYTHHFCSKLMSLRLCEFLCLCNILQAKITENLTCTVFALLINSLCKEFLNCFGQMERIKRSTAIEYDVCCGGGLSWYTSALFRATLSLQVAKSTLKGRINNAISVSYFMRKKLHT